MFRLKLILSAAALLGSLFAFGQGNAAHAETSTAVANDAASATPAPEQRVALVIGNSNYVNAPKLANPGNDAQSMAELLNSAGFEVMAATDLTQSDMVRALQDFSDKVAARGPNTVAMVYYAGHGVQLAGENYLVPVDAKIATPADLTGNSVRLVDIMGTLENVPSRMRIVILDACRNNPFPTVNEATRGLAIVDAPNGSIVGYSTAPGMEAQDGKNGHSPYTNAFLNLAREPNLPIEQLFKRIRLEVNDATDGKQTPWESSSLTSDFTFFGNTAVASARPPERGPVVMMASNLPSRSARQAYDFVLSEGSPDYYEEFITLYPYDPLCDRIRFLLNNWRQVAAWHKAVLANTPFAYKTFHDNFGNSPYAQTALKLQSQPKALPLLQFTKLSNVGQPNNGIKFGDGKLGGGKIVTLPAPGMNKTMSNTTLNATGVGKGKVANLPAMNAGKLGTNQGMKVQKFNDRPKFRPERQTMQVSKPKFGGHSGFNSNARMGGMSHGGGRH
ncbi:caspase family protein [Bradyrhizobium jicamae]|uniref:caspase family protein n=1 Tax=Bradyrhizobium jicamae TaxID=280332 RepID=UPI001BAB67C5|nr:caspase family protein [Bradyrhizobium jicamae]MBR0754517.1 caspase family protein [Bradyrhizobium jicamae]